MFVCVVELKREKGGRRRTREVYLLRGGRPAMADVGFVRKPVRIGHTPSVMSSNAAGGLQRSTAPTFHPQPGDRD